MVEPEASMEVQPQELLIDCTTPNVFLPMAEVISYSKIYFCEKCSLIFISAQRLKLHNERHDHSEQLEEN